MNNNNRSGSSSTKLSGKREREELLNIVYCALKYDDVGDDGHIEYYVVIPLLKTSTNGIQDDGLRPFKFHVSI